MYSPIRPLLLAGIIGWVSFGATAGQTIDHPVAKTPPDRAERAVQAIASGKEPEGDPSHQVPALIAVVEDGEPQESDLAIRALAAMKAKASPAIAAISKKLSDPDHATRGAAIDALAAIGDAAVVPLRELLHSPNARARASAATALSRLKRLDSGEIARLSRDADPRVRAASADALSRIGKPGVPRLVEMLRDPELAVAVEAARALKSNREDASTAISGLTEAVTREHLSSDAGDALSAYGVAAKRAVPALIEAGLKEALEHIGPPSDLDIPKLSEILAHEDEETRIVTAKCLAMLGLNGNSASDALEAAADESIKEYVKRKASPESQSRDRMDNSGRVFLAGEECAAAVWDVTHDTPRFLSLIQRLATAAGCPLAFSRPMGLHDLSPGDRRRFESMLRHPNLDVQETALSVLAAAGPGAGPLENVLIEVVQGRNAEISLKAIETLAAIGPSAGRGSAPALVSKWRDGTLPLVQFADAVRRLEIRSETTRAILERGLRDKDRWTAKSCAITLCIASHEPTRIARLVIGAARDGLIENRDAVAALIGLQDADDVVLPFLVAQLQSGDAWTRHDALDAIGTFGAKASGRITSLERLLSDESPLIRLKAAKAIFRVTNNSIELENQLEMVFAKDDPADRARAIETIGELNRSGARFLHYVLTELRRSPAEYAETEIKALRAIGTEGALAALRATAESTDWILRSRATEALRQLRHLPARGGN